MTKSKYKNGRRITNMTDFEECKSMYYKVVFGNKVQTKHKSFLMSWQFRTLAMFIRNGWVFVAEEAGK